MVDAEMEEAMIQVLLVEDDIEIVKHLTAFLREDGFEVTAVSGQRDALARIEEAPEGIDLILLDVSLSDGNGFAVCAAVKQQTQIPVIFLTASGDEYSTVAGLDMGADDYIGKPFRPRELVSRMKNVLRRCGKTQSVLKMGQIRVDTLSGTVYKNGEEIILSAMEYRLLLVFMNHQGIVLTRSKLLEEIWDAAGEYVNDNTLTVYIKRLREKVEEDSQNPRLIKTVRGMGYMANS